MCHFGLEIFDDVRVCLNDWPFVGTDQERGEHRRSHCCEMKHRVARKVLPKQLGRGVQNAKHTSEARYELAGNHLGMISERCQQNG